MNTIKQLWKALVIVLVTTLSSAAFAQTMSSTSYQVLWDVTDGGGDSMMSTSYTIKDSVAQPSAIGSSMSASYTLAAGFHTPPDSDEDQVKNFFDNCIFDPNPTQLDSNGDGYGNRCDPDLDNSGFVNFADYSLLTAAFLSMPGDANWNPDADLNGDGSVNFGDISIYPIFFLMPPGPSALAP